MRHSKPAQLPAPSPEAQFDIEIEEDEVIVAEAQLTLRQKITEHFKKIGEHSVFLKSEYDDSILGIVFLAGRWVVIYQKDKILKQLISSGMGITEAMDLFDTQVDNDMSSASPKFLENPDYL